MSFNGPQHDSAPAAHPAQSEHWSEASSFAPETRALFSLSSFKDRLAPPTAPLPGELPTPRQMIGYLDRFVFGQHEAKRVLSTAVYLHYLSLASRERGERGFGPQHALLMGPTGCGKTYMVNKLADLLGVPLAFASAASLSQTGFMGDSISNVVADLVSRTAGAERALCRGMIFVDEIDKIRSTSNLDGQRDICGEGVQRELLSLLDGQQFMLRDKAGAVAQEVDLSKILFVFAGAFVGLDQIIEQRRTPHSRLGFDAAGAARPEVITGDARLPQMEDQDLKSYGFIPELVGRFSNIARLHPLSAEDLLQVLTQVEDSALTKQCAFFKAHGVNLHFAGEFLEAAARQAALSGTGARGLAKALQRCVGEVIEILPELWTEGVREVRIAPGTGGQPSIMLLAGESSGDLSRPKALEQRRRIIKNLPEPMTNPNQPLSVEKTWSRIIRIRDNSLQFQSAGAPAKNFWLAFEKNESNSPYLVLLTVEELLKHDATIEELFQAYTASGIANVQGVIDFMLKRRPCLISP